MVRLTDSIITDRLDMTIVVGTLNHKTNKNHKNCLAEVILMSIHNIVFIPIWKIIPKLLSDFHFISFSVLT